MLTEWQNSSCKNDFIAQSDPQIECNIPTIFIKIPIMFCTELEIILKFIQTHKTQKAESNSKQPEQCGGITVPDQEPS